MKPQYDFSKAERRSKRSLRTEPRARAARYDRRTGRIRVDLTNGCSFIFPARKVQGLERATDAQLAQIEIVGLGLALHWERLDVDLSVPGLLAGLFGTKAYMDREHWLRTEGVARYDASHAGRSRRVSADQVGTGLRRHMKAGSRKKRRKAR